MIIQFNLKQILANKLIYSIMIIIMVLFSSKFVYSTQIDKAEDTLIFLGNEKIAPLIYKEKGETKGLVVDIIKELEDKIGYDIQVEATNWKEAQNKLLSKKADALLQINQSPERKELYNFSSDLLKAEFCIFKRADDSSINNIYDLEHKKVGTESLSYPSYILENYNINTVSIADSISGFKMVDSGKLDALIVDRWIGEYALARSKVSGIQIIEEPIEVKYSHIAVLKGENDLLDSINTGLEEIKSDGSMDKILNKWKGKKVVYFTEEEVRKNIYYGLLLTFMIIISGTIFFIVKLKKINYQLELEVIKRTKELRESNKRLKQISMVDGLTNIFNRRYFDNEFKKTWKISLRKNLPLSIILLDIDFFKKYNDKYGHIAGDYCLKKVGKILKSSAKRSSDIAARFGGEEFIIMLFDTSEDGAYMLAEQIRNTIENTIMYYEGNKTSITVSIGVATVIPNQKLDSIDLVELADQAMYKAKNNGRNRVELADIDNHVS